MWVYSKLLMRDLIVCSIKKIFLLHLADVCSCCPETVHCSCFPSSFSIVGHVSYRIITHMTNCHTSILVNCIYCYSSAFTTSLCPRNSPLPRQIATNNAHCAANTCRLIINTCCGGKDTCFCPH